MKRPGPQVTPPADDTPRAVMTPALALPSPYGILPGGPSFHKVWAVLTGSRLTLRVSGMSGPSAPQNPGGGQ